MKHFSFVHIEWTLKWKIVRFKISYFATVRTRKLWYRKTTSQCIWCRYKAFLGFWDSSKSPGLLGLLWKTQKPRTVPGFGTDPILGLWDCSENPKSNHHLDFFSDTQKPRTVLEGLSLWQSPRSQGQSQKHQTVPGQFQF